MSKSTEVVTFTSLSVAKGKGVTALNKYEQNINNGLTAAHCLAIGVQSKQAKEDITLQALHSAAHKLAFSSCKVAAAMVVAKSGAAVSLLETQKIDKDNNPVFDAQGNPVMVASYTEWLRMGQTLKGMAQVTLKGKPTNAAKALQLFNQLSDIAASLRADKEAKKALQIAAPAAAAPAAPAPAGEALI